MSNLETLPALAVPAHMKDVRISIDDFLDKWSKGACEFIDIRVPGETRIWKMSFGLHIPADEIAGRLDELPRDRLLVIACPYSDRSSIVSSYLTARGFDTKYLSGGLLKLAEKLKGPSAASFNLEPVR